MDDFEYTERLRQFLLDTVPTRRDLDKLLSQVDFSIDQWGGFGQDSSAAENYLKLVQHFSSKGQQDLLAFAAICENLSHGSAGNASEKLLSPLKKLGVNLFPALNDNRIEAGWVTKACQQVEFTQAREHIWSYSQSAKRLTKLLAIFDLLTNAESHQHDYVTPFVNAIAVNLGAESDLAKKLRLIGSAMVNDAGLIATSLLPAPTASDLEHVLISVDESPSPSAQVRWNVNAFRSVANGEPQLIANAEAELSEVDFPKYLGQLRNTLDELGIVVDRVVLHFFLPPKMLSRPIDQWCFTASEGFDLQVKCGEEFRVVVRLSKQIKLRSTRLDSRWKVLKQSSLCREAEHFLSCSPASPLEETYRKFQSLDKLQCVIINAPVSIDDDPEKVPCLVAAFLAGIPIVIWGRDAASVPVLVHEAKQWLGNSLVQLPDLVQKYRRESTANLRDHVTLLFEDADRKLPQSTRLKAARV